VAFLVDFHFIEVFCKTVCFVMEGSFVLFVPREKSSTSLSDVCLNAIRAGKFVCSG